MAIVHHLPFTKVSSAPERSYMDRKCRAFVVLRSRPPLESRQGAFLKFISKAVMPEPGVGRGPEPQRHTGRWLQSRGRVEIISTQPSKGSLYCPATHIDGDAYFPVTSMLMEVASATRVALYALSANALKANRRGCNDLCRR